MRFLIDAQLPARLARFLSDAGHDALHTSELAESNRTTDAQIAEQADRDQRVVVTKDRDFRDTHLLARSPQRLLVVATGNITNTALLALFEANLEAIVGALNDVDFVEISAHSLVLHRRQGPADTSATP